MVIRDTYYSWSENIIPKLSFGRSGLDRLTALYIDTGSPYLILGLHV
jgi:hypothetical protein